MLPMFILLCLSTLTLASLWQCTALLIWSVLLGGWSWLMGHQKQCEGQCWLGDCLKPYAFCKTLPKRIPTRHWLYPRSGPEPDVNEVLGEGPPWLKLMGAWALLMPWKGFFSNSAGVKGWFTSAKLITQAHVSGQSWKRLDNYFISKPLPLVFFKCLLSSIALLCIFNHKIFEYRETGYISTIFTHTLHFMWKLLKRHLWCT